MTLLCAVGGWLDGWGDGAPVCADAGGADMSLEFAAAAREVARLPVPAPLPCDFVFITRKDSRAMANADELHEWTQRHYGVRFKDVTFEDTTPQYQVATLSGAAVAWGVTGAAFANSIFMSPGSSVVIFMPLGVWSQPLEVFWNWTKPVQTSYAPWVPVDLRSAVLDWGCSYRWIGMSADALTATYDQRVCFRRGGVLIDVVDAAPRLHAAMARAEGRCPAAARRWHERAIVRAAGAAMVAPGFSPLASRDAKATGVVGLGAWATGAADALLRTLKCIGTAVAAVDADFAGYNDNDAEENKAASLPFGGWRQLLGRMQAGLPRALCCSHGAHLPREATAYALDNAAAGAVVALVARAQFVGELRRAAAAMHALMQTTGAVPERCAPVRAGGPQLEFSSAFCSVSGAAAPHPAFGTVCHCTFNNVVLEGDRVIFFAAADGARYARHVVACGRPPPDGGREMDGPGPYHVAMDGSSVVVRIVAVRREEFLAAGRERRIDKPVVLATPPRAGAWAPGWSLVQYALATAASAGRGSREVLWSWASPPAADAGPAAAAVAAALAGCGGRGAPCAPARFDRSYAGTVVIGPDPAMLTTTSLPFVLAPHAAVNAVRVAAGVAAAPARQHAQPIVVEVRPGDAVSLAVQAALQLGAGCAKCRFVAPAELADAVLGGGVDAVVVSAAGDGASVLPVLPASATLVMVLAGGPGERPNACVPLRMRVNFLCERALGQCVVKCVVAQVFRGGGAGRDGGGDGRCAERARGAAVRPGRTRSWGGRRAVDDRPRRRAARVCYILGVGVGCYILGVG